MTGLRKQAGQSTREMARRRWKSALLTLLIVLFVAIVLGLLVLNAKTLGIGGGAVLVILLAMKGIEIWANKYDRRSTKLEKRATRGAIAEERIGHSLESLGADYIILHDIESPFGNIDHIVIGKTNGLFLIETKSHHGKIQIDNGELLLNGHLPEKNFIGQVLKNTYWLKERVGEITGTQLWITPILVFTNAFVPFLDPIKGVRIINSKFLIQTIQNNGKSSMINTSIWDEKGRIEQGLLARKGG